MASNRIPPLNALRCFERAARCENFTLAADELCLTPSAVSHQVRILEEHLGKKLFERSGRRMALTEAGQIYFELISKAFDLIVEARSVLARQSNTQKLMIGIPPDFTTAWLMPRIRSFIEENEDIQLYFVTSPRDNGIAEQKLDCEIRYGHGKWPTVEAIHLLHDDLIPVCSPTLLSSRPPLAAPSDICAFPLIFTGNRLLNWWQWADYFEVQNLGQCNAIHIDRSALSVTAAIHGLGIALESTLATSEFLKSGQLVALPYRYENPEAYYFVSSPALGAQPCVARLRDWLLAELNPSGVEAPHASYKLQHGKKIQCAAP